MIVRPFYDGHRVAFSVTGTTPGIKPVAMKEAIGRMRLSTESVGSVNITFSGVKAGSEIYIFDSSRNQLDGVESATDPQTFSLQRYAVGNPLNNVRIFIASLGYENIDLSYTLPTTDSTIPIQQRIDRNYRNP